MILAKLREFRKGMDVEDYLATEHRQNIRDLDLLIAQQRSASGATSIEFFLKSDPGYVFRNATALTADYDFSNTEIFNKSFIVEGNSISLPTAQYAIDLSCSFEDSRLAGGVFSGSCNLVDDLNNVVLSCSFLDLYGRASIRTQYASTFFVPESARKYRISLNTAGNNDFFISAITLKFIKFS